MSKLVRETYSYSDLRRLIDPRVVAVVGASETPGSFGQRTLANMSEFDPDAPTLASSWRDFPAGDGGKKAGHRGEHDISCKPKFMRSIRNTRSSSNDRAFLRLPTFLRCPIASFCAWHARW
jgi:hypothetical protein